MASAPKQPTELYARAREDMVAPDRDKALKWVYWAAEYGAHLEGLLEKQGRLDAYARINAIRIGEEPFASSALDQDIFQERLSLGIAVHIRDLLVSVVAPSMRDAATQPPPLRSIQGGAK